MSGLIALAAVAMPLISPPPPIGTTSTSRSGTAASISSATVPAPEITAGSSNGWTKTSPCSPSSCLAWAWASSNRSPWRMTVAPWPSVWVTFIVGVLTGITIVTGMPSLLP